MLISKKKLGTIALILIPLLMLAQKPTVIDPELNQPVPPKSKVAKRSLRYTPQQGDFVIVNGKIKFNRALYSPLHNGFRIETSDVPEFALYLPRMGGNLSFSLFTNKHHLALNLAEKIICRYRPGKRMYEISDRLLGKGWIEMEVLPLSRASGMILRITPHQLTQKIGLESVFGGAADKRFAREGDLGVDPPDCFELKPEYCKNNHFSTDKNYFSLSFGQKNERKLNGIFPTDAHLQATTGDAPVLKSSFGLFHDVVYIYIAIPASENLKPDYGQLSTEYEQSEKVRSITASQLSIETPDDYLNTLGATISLAADGIWSGETWLHGAVGWRMPLSGWRAAYAGDALGWHDRARKHFNAYADSQVKNIQPILQHPNQDTALHLARAVKTWGTQMYSNGYICRNPHENNKMHHYDMNLCYIDELLWHLQWTGDLQYARQIWPVIESSLAWEKRNFDPDNDGLYDAYCCIWASDGLYYNSGAVTHSSAYNYRANKLAGLIAAKTGIDPTPYQAEAARILKAMNQKLWLNNEGHWAEFIDFMGNKMLHPDAALWTIYHAIDSETGDAFQNYQNTRYVDTQIPHIPVETGKPDNNHYYTLSSSNWLPYCWSTNNVVTAEVLHTALAFWEAGRNEEAAKIFKSTILDAMYMGSSPGNISQISFYDAARGECYRDFGDPIGVISRTVVQGLFGITPNLLNHSLVLRPGFPASWNHAAITTPDISFRFNRNKLTDIYQIDSKLSACDSITLQLKCYYSKIRSIKVNKQEVKWSAVSTAGDFPVIAIPAGKGGTVVVSYDGEALKLPEHLKIYQSGETIKLNNKCQYIGINDPQHILSDVKTDNHLFEARLNATAGNHCFFVLQKQDQMQWWQAIDVAVERKKTVTQTDFSELKTARCETIDIDRYFNDSLNNIFKHRYVSPRSPYTTLQIPVQGIGEWCHPTKTATINDEKLRQLAQNNQINTSIGIPFRTPASGKNIAFTSLWDNFPQAISVSLSGKASHAYLMLAGTTNQMQSHIVNGRVCVEYTDGGSDTLNLINPENWCPIEQDYYIDGKAFVSKSPRPYRIHFGSGMVSNNLEKELNIDGVYGRTIPDGAGLILDMKIDQSRNLKKISIETTANEVIVGLMAITLQR